MKEMVKLALASAALKAVEELVTRRAAEVREELTVKYVKAYKAMGLKSLDVSWAGKKVATATLSIPKAPVLGVTNEGLFRSWVEQNAPDQVDVFTPPPPAPTRTMRAEFVSDLLARLVETPEGWVDPETGEVVPGVTLPPTPAPKSYSIRFADGGAEYLLEAWRQGELAGLDAPALPAKEGE